MKAKEFLDNGDLYNGLQTLTDDNNGFIDEEHLIYVMTGYAKAVLDEYIERVKKAIDE